MKFYGFDESKVFGGISDMLGIFGDLDIAQYKFVFRIRNVLVKVFVSASNKTTYSEALIFAKEAIARK